MKLLLILTTAALLTSCAETEQYRAEYAQQRAAATLLARYRRYTTTELQLMHTRYTELLDRTRRLDAGINAHDSTPDQRNFEHLLEIERELLRRHQLGDKDA